MPLMVPAFMLSVDGAGTARLDVLTSFRLTRTGAPIGRLSMRGTTRKARPWTSTLRSVGAIGGEVIDAVPKEVPPGRTKMSG